MKTLFITVKKIKGDKKHFAFNKPAITIGSALTNDLIINDHRIDATAFEIKIDGKKTVGRHPAGAYQEIDKKNPIRLGEFEISVKSNQAVKLLSFGMLILFIPVILLLFLPENNQRTDIAQQNTINTVGEEKHFEAPIDNPYIKLSQQELKRTYDNLIELGKEKLTKTEIDKGNYLRSFLHFYDAHLAAEAGGINMKSEMEQSERLKTETIDKIMKEIEESLARVYRMEKLGEYGNAVDYLQRERFSYFPSFIDLKNVPEEILEKEREFKDLELVLSAKAKAEKKGIF